MINVTLKMNNILKYIQITQFLKHIQLIKGRSCYAFVDNIRWYLNMYVLLNVMCPSKFNIVVFS